MPTYLGNLADRAMFDTSMQNGDHNSFTAVYDPHHARDADALNASLARNRALSPSQKISSPKAFQLESRDIVHER
jgi:hypothetical protein